MAQHAGAAARPASPGRGVPTSRGPPAPAGDAIRLPDAFLSAAILVVIPLGTSPSLGAIGYGTRVPEGVLHDWPFVVAMRPAATPEAAQSAIDDDALWPDAASVAG